MTRPSFKKKHGSNMECVKLVVVQPDESALAWKKRGFLSGMPSDEATRHTVQDPDIISSSAFLSASSSILNANMS
eukprot:1142405-Pelagomonas_calceolata.AAC.9